MNLRPYQTTLIECARVHMRRGAKSILITSPTGSGKTLLTAYMLREAAARGKRSLFLVHRRELVLQSVEAFRAMGLEPGVIAAGFPPNPTAPVQIASVQSLARRDCPPAELVVWDEAHHIAARTWTALRARYPEAHHIGLTATPERTDGRGLAEHFETLLQGPEVADLIEDGYLSPFRYYAPGGIDTTGIKRRVGDFERGALASAADKPTITGSAVEHYQRLCPTARAIVFCVGREHADHVAAQFQQQGIPARCVDGNTPEEERDEAIASFKEGRVKVLTNCEIFTEGFDVPAVEAAILLRPTQSLGLFLQMCGRALRPAVGKTHALILDHAGNVERHGLPDETRAWDIRGRASRGGGQVDDPGLTIRICPVCYAALRAPTSACGACGASVPEKPRKVSLTAGQLREIKAAEAARLREEARRRRKEQGQAGTLEDLLAIARERGYGAGWARKVFYGRRR